MKKFTFFVLLLLNIYSAKGQPTGEFMHMPLAYPTDAYKYSPESMSIVDHDHLWVATIKRNAAAIVKSYYQAAKTSDGGNSWQLFQIPATGNNFLPDVEAQSNITANKVATINIFKLEELVFNAYNELRRRIENDEFLTECKNIFDHLLANPDGLEEGITIHKQYDKLTPLVQNWIRF